MPRDAPAAGNGKARLMKFTLDVDMDALAGAPEEELGRILRYWAGNLKHYDLVTGTSETISDSAYTPVGTWRIEGPND